MKYKQISPDQIKQNKILGVSGWVSNRCVTRFFQGHTPGKHPLKHGNMEKTFSQVSVGSEFT
jgi:hypothetical protein